MAEHERDFSRLERAALIVASGSVAGFGPEETAVRAVATAEAILAACAGPSELKWCAREIEKLARGVGNVYIERRLRRVASIITNYPMPGPSDEFQPNREAIAALIREDAEEQAAFQLHEAHAERPDDE